MAGLIALATAGTAAVSTWLGSVRGGYSPLAMSLSVLGERGGDHAVVFNVALALFGAVLVVAGAVVWSARPGRWIVLAGALTVGLALVPIDPRSSGITLVHRVLTALVLMSLVVAAFTDTPAPGWPATLTRIARWLAPIGLLLGAGLLVDGFPGGLWERAMFVLLLSWLEVCLTQPAQTPAPTSAASAAS